MEKKSINNLKGTLIIPVVLGVILVPVSLLIGWNIFTLFLFWFMLIPALAMRLPRLVSSNKNHLFESISGLIAFYGIIVFMIYDHYKTDYFKIMILSCLVNLILISVMTLTKKPGSQTLMIEEE